MFHFRKKIVIQVSQNWLLHNYLLPYQGCLNVHEKNIENIFQTKKSIIVIIIINGNTTTYNVNKDILVHRNLVMLP
jgi:hypothetical protein